MMVTNLRGEMTVEVSPNVSDLFLDSDSYLSKVFISYIIVIY